MTLLHFMYLDGYTSAQRLFEGMTAWRGFSFVLKEGLGCHLLAKQVKVLSFILNKGAGGKKQGKKEGEIKTLKLF